MSGTTRRPPRGTAGGRRAFAGGLLGLVPAVLLACAVESPTPPAPPPAGAAPAHRLVVLGIDGAEWGVIDAMTAAGELPHFAAMRRRGAWAQLVNPGPTLSPAVWTTVATGHFPRLHGILDFVYPYREQPTKRPVDSGLRLQPAIWNLASAEGLRVGLVGYMVSHPAEPVEGLVVSDRAAQKLPRATHPEDLLEELSARLPDLLAAGQGMDRFIGWSDDPARPWKPGSPHARATELLADRLAHRIPIDTFLRRATLELLDRESDLFISYFRLVDVASHSLWRFYDDRDFEAATDPREKELLGEIIPESYRFMDEILGEIARRAPEANIVVLSDHGFGSATGRFAMKRAEYRLLSGNHRPDGIFLAAGPDIRPGRISGLTVMEMMPTLCALLDLPVSRELPGRVAEELLGAELMADRPPRFVERYEPGPLAAAGPPELDPAAEEEELRSLAALGYIESDLRVFASATDDYDFWSVDERLVLDHMAGELSYHLVRGDRPAAAATLALVGARRADLELGVLARAINTLTVLQRELAEPDTPLAEGVEWLRAARRERLLHPPAATTAATGE